MRNEAMVRLDGLVGQWTTTLSDAWFIDPAGTEVRASTSIEWLGEAFIVVTTSDMPGGTTTFVIGYSDPNEAYSLLAHDERGVCRVFDMTFDGTNWTISREDPDFHQRFIAVVGPDDIDGRWEASEDHGQTWRKDFDLRFVRAS